MLSRILRTAAVVYLFIGTGLMWAANAMDGKATPCACCTHDNPTDNAPRQLPEQAESLVG